MLVNLLKSTTLSGLKFGKKLMGLIKRLAFYCIFLHMPFQMLAQDGTFRILDRHNFIEIPFVKHNNLIIIPVTINSRLTLQFILDTGVQYAILTEKTYGDFLGLTYDKRVTLSAPGNVEEINALVAKNARISLPGVYGGEQTMLVLEEDYLNLRSNLGFEVHGIIGYEIFKNFVVDINYDISLITLIEPSTFKARKKMTAIPIEILNGKPYLLASVRQKTGDNIIGVKLMVDTGASHALLLEHDSDSALLLPQVNLPAFLGKGLGGEIPGYISRTQAFQMGPYRFENVVTSFPDKAVYRMTDIDGRNGTIGGEVMTRFNPIFDYFNNTIYLRKSRKYGVPFHHDMSGMEFIAFGRYLDQIVVTNIAPNSPAEEAGIRVGDQILIINGFRMGPTNFRYVNKLLRTKPGKKINVTLQREDEKFIAKFKLRQMI